MTLYILPTQHDMLAAKLGCVSDIKRTGGEKSFDTLISSPLTKTEVCIMQTIPDGHEVVIYRREGPNFK